MKYEELIINLRKKEYAPVYLLHGEEPYYIDLATDFFENNILDPTAREFDLTVAYGKDLENDLSPVIMEARRFPMMGQYHVVIIKEAQVVRKWEMLETYLSTPMPTTIFVIAYKYGKFDARLKAYKSLAKAGVVMDSPKIPDYNLSKWIADYIKEWNREHSQTDEVQIDEKLVALLAETIDNDLSKIVGALKRLIDGRPVGTNKITLELAQRNLGINKDYNIFELHDALATRNEEKAYRIALYFSQSKQHAIQKEIVSLFGFFSNLLIAAFSGYKRSNELMSVMSMPFPIAKKMEEGLGKYNKAQLVRIISFIREADARSKGFNAKTYAEDEDIWKELIYKILHC